MCYSVKTSIISYILGIIAGIFALSTRQITLGILILTYSQMQLAELLIWFGIDTDNDNLNRSGTSYGNNINFIINGPSISTKQLWIYGGDNINNLPLY